MTKLCHLNYSYRPGIILFMVVERPLGVPWITNWWSFFIMDWTDDEGRPKNSKKPFICPFKKKNEEGQSVVKVIKGNFCWIKLSQQKIIRDHWTRTIVPNDFFLTQWRTFANYRKFGCRFWFSCMKEMDVKWTAQFPRWVAQLRWNGLASGTS